MQVDTEAVEEAVVADGEGVRLRERLAVGADRIGVDGARRLLDMGLAGVGDIEDGLVGREGEPVRPHPIARDRRRFARRGIEPVDERRADLARGERALVVALSIP